MAQTEEEKAAAEAEAKKAEEQRIADMVNRAAADHAKRIQAKFEKQLEERDQKIAQLEAAAAGKKPEGEPAVPGDQKPDPRYAELEARIRASEKKAEDERKARETEQKARRAEEEKNATLQALTSAEITGDLQEAALLVLQAKGRIGRDEAGNVCYLDQKEGYVDKIPVAEGVKKWAEGDGKAYLPARGVGGAGTKPPARGATPPAATGKNAKIAQAKKDLAAVFFGKTDEQ